MQLESNANISNSRDRPSPCDNPGNSANKGHKHFSRSVKLSKTCDLNTKI